MRPISAQATDEDQQLDVTLRPKTWEEFIGQAKVKEILSIAIEAALQRGEALDHVVLYGPPGLGKTTLAYLIATQMSVDIKTTSGPVLERKDDLAAILTNLDRCDVLFIDEIHRLNRVVEECLYPAMEDYNIDVIYGEGAYAKAIRLTLPRFTLVGSTTRVGMLTSPLRDRFGIVLQLRYYEVEDMRKIVRRSGQILGIEIDDDGEMEIARRSRRTPRVANRLLKRVRDYVQVRGSGRIDKQGAREALELLEIDEEGLDEVDRRYMRTIIRNFSGGPVGLNTLSTALSEDSRTIEEVIEPYLVQMGFLDRSPRGRLVTTRAYEHLQIAVRQQERLF